MKQSGEYKPFIASFFSRRATASKTQGLAAGACNESKSAHINDPDNVASTLEDPADAIITATVTKARFVMWRPRPQQVLQWGRRIGSRTPSAHLATSPGVALRWRCLRRLRSERHRSIYSLLPPSWLNTLLVWSWRVDIISYVFLALVAAVVRASPASLGATWLSAEVVFFLWYTTVRLPRLDRLGQGSHESSSMLQRAEALFQRMLDEREGALQVLRDYPHHLSNWFIGQGGKPCGLSEVTTLLDHLLLQGQARELLATENQDVLHDMAASLVAKLGLEPQCADDVEVDAGLAAVRPLAADKEPLMVCYRPLLFYVLMEAIAGWAHFALTVQLGFRRAARTAHATYYLKKGANKHLPPIVLVHGIGVGLAPYVRFIARLQRCTGRTVIAVQYRHISMRMTHLMPSPTQLAVDLELFLAKQGFSKAAIVCHSYGTLVASALVKRNPGLVSELTLVDPVCFAMFLPHLIRNALFFHVVRQEAAQGMQPDVSPPRGHRFSPRTLLRGVVVRDVHVAAALSRSTPWGDCNLFPTDLPADTKVHVVLSELDNLVPVQEVVSMLGSTLTASQAQVQVFPGRGHGAFVVDLSMQEHVISGLCGTPPLTKVASTESIITLRPYGPHLPSIGPIQFMRRPFQSISILYVRMRGANQQAGSRKCFQRERSLRTGARWRWFARS